MPKCASEEKGPSMQTLARTHPIVPIVLAMRSDCLTETLPVFIQHELQHTKKKQVPVTMAEFYHDYVQVRITTKMREMILQYGRRHVTQYAFCSVIHGLSIMAYAHYVKNERITQGTVTKMCKSPVETLLIMDPIVDVQLRTYGLLERDVDGEKRSGRMEFRFQEPLVEQYLVARHLRNVFLYKISQQKDTLKGPLRQTMNRLPVTGDIWRMAFALFNDNPKTREHQGEILSELINVAKTIDGLSSFDVTSLCVEAIYESQNAAMLTDHIDEFTLNETINYSHAFVPRARLPYSLAAVGYFVRACEHVYGLHLSNFGLNVDRVALLADPVNAVSDNHLQVLNLSRNTLGRNGMVKLQRFIVKATFLTHLDMSDCALGPGGASLLSEYFMCMPLVYLNLAENDIGDKGLLRMLKNCEYLTNLEWLDLSCNALSGVSMVPFAQRHLPAMRTLRSLDVRHNLLDEAVISALSKVLTTLTQLEHVSLTENRGSDQSATAMMQQAWKSTSLRHVNINLNQIPAEGILGLRRITLSRDELSIPPLDQSSQSVSYLPDDSTLNDTSVISDVCDVSFDFLTPAQLDKSVSVDLLAGRPDKQRAVQLRRHTSRAGSLPRMRDIRRSWHGMGASMRESMREKRASLNSTRASLRGTRESVGVQTPHVIPESSEHDSSKHHSPATVSKNSRETTFHATNEKNTEENHKKSSPKSPKMTKSDGNIPENDVKGGKSAEKSKSSGDLIGSRVSLFQSLRNSTTNLRNSLRRTDKSRDVTQNSSKSPPGFTSPESTRSSNASNTPNNTRITPTSTPNCAAQENQMIRRAMFTETPV